MPSQSYWQEEDNLAKITKWASLGFTNEQIADNMDVCPRTFRGYKKKFKKFNNALMDGRLGTNTHVLSEFNKSCRGYTYTEDIVINGKIEKIEKFQKPNMVAILFALRNNLGWTSNNQEDKRKTEKEIKKLELEIASLEITNSVDDSRLANFLSADADIVKDDDENDGS